MHPQVIADASVWVSQASSQEVYHKQSSDWLTRYVSSGGLLVEPEIVLLRSSVRHCQADRSGKARPTGVDYHA